MRDYKADAVLGLSNFGGISIMIDPEDSDYLYYKWYEEEPVRAEIYYKVEKGNPEEESDSFPVFFKTEEDVEYRIDEFMKVI